MKRLKLLLLVLFVSIICINCNNNRRLTQGQPVGYPNVCFTKSAYDIKMRKMNKTYKAPRTTTRRNVVFKKEN